MTNEKQAPIDITKVSLGWEIVIECGTCELEALRIYADLRNDTSYPPMLVLLENGVYSIWTCKRPFWPFS